MNDRGYNTVNVKIIKNLMLKRSYPCPIKIKKRVYMQLLNGGEFIAEDKWYAPYMVIKRLKVEKLASGLLMCTPEGNHKDRHFFIRPDQTVQPNVLPIDEVNSIISGLNHGLGSPKIPSSGDPYGRVPFRYHDSKSI